jgi:hypothetical protein
MDKESNCQVIDIYKMCKIKWDVTIILTIKEAWNWDFNR